jgi:hypothetical protein
VEPERREISATRRSLGKGIKWPADRYAER